MNLDFTQMLEEHDRKQEEEKARKTKHIEITIIPHVPVITIEGIKK